MNDKAPTEWLTTREVADMFGVDRKTVTRWVIAGRIATVRTPGGHHRFPAAQIKALLTPSTIGA